MNESSDKRCAEIQERLAWIPTEELDAEERRWIEEHAAICPACAERLKLAHDLKDHLHEKPPHLDPDLLIRAVAERDSLTERERRLADEHLAACAHCREEARILQSLDRPAAHRGRGTWETLARTLLQPIPAAAYLMAAIVAVVLLGTRQRGEELHPVGEVVLLPDMGVVTRAADAADEGATAIAAGEQHFLLLEFLNLREPPAADGIYALKILKEGGSEMPSYVQRVSGRSFRETYSLGLVITPGMLRAGRYTIEVQDPQGEAIYRTRITVE